MMIGKFRVIKVLGRGGMGEVLLAHDDLGRRVAIKRPLPDAAADGLERFRIEAKAATLTHPNIPVVYEMGAQEDGLPFIAMEFVDGEPLDKVIASGRELDLILKLSIIEQVCSGLAYAHQNGIIHRDIKPGNIILQPNGVAKIIDFGIAKDTNSDNGLTRGLVIGTMHYIAPERYTGKAVDGRVDVFSVGVMLYLLLTGRLPFEGGEFTASYRIVHEAHSGLSNHLKDYPPALDAIMDQALAKDANKRFTAEDLGDALREVANELKRTRVSVLFGDAERLTVESRYEPALDLLDEAVRLDPANTQVRKLRKLVREHQERHRRGERLKECVLKADEYLAAQNYVDAITSLKEAQQIDPESAEVKAKIVLVQEQKRRSDACSAALADADACMNRGDVSAALKILERAATQDPENTKLLAARAAIAKQLEREAVKAEVDTLLDAARRELAQQNFAAMEQRLSEVEALDSTHPQIEKMRADLAATRAQQERRKFLDGVQHHVNEFLRNDQYDLATQLLKGAIEKLPDEITLHRLKMEVDAAARSFDSKRVVDAAIAAARQTFVDNPQKALADLRRLIEQMPGEQRLIDYEISLREQDDRQRKQQRLSDTLRAAREALDSRQLDKAVSILEEYQLEHGKQADIDELLKVAQQELSTQLLRAFIDRTTAEVRTLREKRPLDAIRLLESAVKDKKLVASGDKTLARLLEEIREQLAAAARKLEAVEKRAQLLSQRAQALSQRGELAEAIKLLEEFLATGGQNAAIENLLHTLEAEQERKQATVRAIHSATESAGKAQFTAAFESLKAIARAYGESDELAQADKQIKAARSAHAQKVVSRSIEVSRAALLSNDVPGAMNALREASPMVEFADAARQADWRRIGQAAKKAESEPASAGAVIVDPLDRLAAPRKWPLPIPVLGGIGAACLLAAAVVVYVMHKPSPPPTVVTAPTEAHISIGNFPVGALVSIDNGPQVQIDGSGTLTRTVQPGPHQLAVTMSGYDPYTGSFQVGAGGTYSEPVPLIKTLVGKETGTLVMQGNIAGFKIAVDGRPYGEIMRKEGSRPLEVGSHTIRYTNVDGSDPQEHTIQITAGKKTIDKFTLKAPVVVLGGLMIKTNAQAKITVDGVTKGSANESEKLQIDSLPVGNHVVDISLDGFQAISGRSVTVAAGQVSPFDLHLQPLNKPPPPPPATGSLVIRTQVGAQISFNNGQHRGTADSSGLFSLTDLAPGEYPVDITLNKFQNYHDTAVIAVGNNSLRAALTPMPEPIKPTSGSDRPVVVVADTSAADLQGIDTALRNFERAYNSKNIAAVQATWMDIGAKSKSLDEIFKNKEFNLVHIEESCSGRPKITGDTATQNCTETTQSSTVGGPNTHPKTIIFFKNNGTWVMKDRR